MPIEFRDAPKRRRLAEELTRRRHDLDLSAREVARRLGWSQSKLAKLEVARTKPSVTDVAEWCAVMQVARADRERLAALAEEVAVEARRWPGSEHGDTAAELDARTEHLAVFSGAAVPRLLRTAAYAAAVEAVTAVTGPAAGRGDGHGDGRVGGSRFATGPPGGSAPSAAPVASAAVAAVALVAPVSSGEAAGPAAEDRPALLRGRSRRVEMVVTEAALRWSPGRAGDHAAQLDRVADLAALPSLTVAVLPSGAGGPPPYAPFAVRRLAGDEDPFVEVETLTGTGYEGRPEQVAAYEAALAAYRPLTVRGERARDLIHELAAEVRASRRAPPGGRGRRGG